MNEGGTRSVRRSVNLHAAPKCSRDDQLFMGRVGSTTRVAREPRTNQTSRLGPWLGFCTLWGVPSVAMAFSEVMVTDLAAHISSKEGGTFSKWSTKYSITT